MKLSRTVSYGVQAALRLVEADTSRPVPCSRLAAEGKMPERFLLQILRHLVNHGIMQSTRGVDGGYTLTRTPDKISLLDILEAIEGPIKSEIPASVHVAPEQAALLQSALAKVAHATRDQMAAIKLTDLMLPKHVRVAQPV